jgi:hypothetical protein
MRRVAAYGALIVMPIMMLGSARPEMYRIPLEATVDAPGASGAAALTRAASVFGMALTPDGHVIYDVHVVVHGLPAPSTYAGATTYVAWATVPDLSLAQRLGALGPGDSTVGRVAWNKFIVLVTPEHAAAGARWAGPILVRGASASTWMQRFQSHVLNNGGNPQW